MPSKLCESCVHTKVCMLDKNLVGDVFVMGNPDFFDNEKLYEEYKKREAVIRQKLAEQDKLYGTSIDLSETRNKEYYVLLDMYHNAIGTSTTPKTHTVDLSGTKKEDTNKTNSYKGNANATDLGAPSSKEGSTTIIPGTYGEITVSDISSPETMSTKLATSIDALRDGEYIALTPIKRDELNNSNLAFKVLSNAGAGVVEIYQDGKPVYYTTIKGAQLIGRKDLNEPLAKQTLPSGMGNDPKYQVAGLPKIEATVNQGDILATTGDSFKLPDGEADVSANSVSSNDIDSKNAEIKKAIDESNKKTQKAIEEKKEQEIREKYDELVNEREAKEQEIADRIVAEAYKYDDYLYSQDKRGTGNFIDCSLLVYKVAKGVGLPAPPPQTGQMVKWCTDGAGIGTKISLDEIRPGDILLKPGHTEIYLGNGKTFGAHTADYPADRQVGVVDMRNDYTHAIRLYKGVELDGVPDMTGVSFEDFKAAEEAAKAEAVSQDTQTDAEYIMEE